MIVKNEFVEIKSGSKRYIRKNMLMNNYLKKIFESQINISHETSEITNCYLKFDTPIENVDYGTILERNDFDVMLFGRKDENDFKKMSTRGENFIRIRYEFKTSSVFEYDGWQRNYYDFSIFNGKKVTAIGFGDGYNVFAFLDVANMNIVINTEEELTISRVDLFQSDGVCYGIDFPLHLVNDSAHYDTKLKKSGELYYSYETKAQLYSVGFGNKIGLMEEEHLISDVEIGRDDTSITFNVQRDKKIGHYPSEDLHLGFYPTMDNSKYLIFKYRLYEHQIGFDDGDNIYLDEYYTMSMPNENFGNLNVKLKIERL